MRVGKALLEVQLVAQRVAIRVVGLLCITASIGQQTVTALVDERIVGEAHLIGTRIVVGLATVLCPFVLEHQVIAEPLQELGLGIDERTDADAAGVGLALVQRLQHIEAVRHQSRCVLHLTDA